MFHVIIRKSERNIKNNFFYTYEIYEKIKFPIGSMKRLAANWSENHSLRLENWLEHKVKVKDT